MSFRDEQRKKFLFLNIFRTKEKKASKQKDLLPDSSAEFEDSPTSSATASPVLRKSFLERKSSRLGSINFSEFSSPVASDLETRSFRIFVATWNVVGKPPHDGLNLNTFLPADDHSDVYVIGFQEVVPLNAGNVLILEDNEPATKWLSLLNQALNKPLVTETTSCPNTPLHHTNSFSSQASSIRFSKTNDTRSFLRKPSLKLVSRTFMTDEEKQLKTCNCISEVALKNYADSCFRYPKSYISEDDLSEGEEEGEQSSLMATKKVVANCASNKQQRYSLIVSKQMVGVFVTVWVRKELVQHIGHVRLSCVGCGIMGCLRNKGCISVSMSLHQTSFCFVCSHLASGEKEGDELRRNSDVIETLKNTHFPKICKAPGRRNPPRILEHERVIWLGDLNYRIALSNSETRRLLQNNDWITLFEKDQLNNEREAGRVFNGWNEGKIYFAPTYKYSNNSDAYAGDIGSSKKKRRTPAWCDRILWYGRGIVQLSYIRGESRFSDHRPVIAVFAVEVGMVKDKCKMELSTLNMKVGMEELLPPTSG